MKTTIESKILWFATYLLPIAPAVWLGIAILAGATTANPVQYLERRTGDYALVMLLLSLTSTPLRWLTGKSFFKPMRRSFGLYTFFYAAAHFLLFIGLDYSWNLSLIRQAFTGKTFLWLGLAALTILLVLAITSIRSVRRKIARYWERIHSLTYVVGLIIATHFLLAIKGNPGTLSGAYLYPILAYAILLILLIVRLPVFHSLIERLRGKIIELPRK